MSSNFKKPKPQETNASDIAAAAFLWLAQEEDMLLRFLALSGLEAGRLRASSSDPGFLAAVLDFVMAHEPTLIAFCDATGNNPEDVAAAWTRLSGPGLASGEW